jgi:negative regulator of replication initiation
LNIDLPTVSDDDVMELYMYIDCAVSQMGEPESKNLRQLFDFIRQKRREIEEDRWRADPANWGACCPWPDDDFPF